MLLIERGPKYWPIRMREKLRLWVRRNGRKALLPEALNRIPSDGQGFFLRFNLDR